MTYIFVELDTELKAQSIEFFSSCPVSRPAHSPSRISESDAAHATPRTRGKSSPDSWNTEAREGGRTVLPLEAAVELGLVDRDGRHAVWRLPFFERFKGC